MTDRIKVIWPNSGVGIVAIDTSKSDSQILVDLAMVLSTKRVKHRLDKGFYTMSHVGGLFTLTPKSILKIVRVEKEHMSIYGVIVEVEDEGKAVLVPT